MPAALDRQAPGGERQAQGVSAHRADDVSAETSQPVAAHVAPGPVTANPDPAEASITGHPSPAEAALLRTAPSGPPKTTGYHWHLPRGFPVPAVPPDNPMSEAKVALGRRLFSETKLSLTGRYSCASCHVPELSYTDGRPVAIGATGGRLDRNTMSLVNVAYNISFGWQHPEVKTLEQQMLQPLYNRHPVELGLGGREAEVIRLLAADRRYVAEFEAAFPEVGAPALGIPGTPGAAAGATTPAAGDSAPVGRPAGAGMAGTADAAVGTTSANAAGVRAIIVPNIIKAIAAFERTLISGDSPFDRYVFGGDSHALSSAARRGMTLFFSGRLGCSGCHSGFNFSGNWRDSQGETGPASFADDGTGVVVKVPTLRNLSRTGPYLHDGRYRTLEEVVRRYEEEGREAAHGRPESDRSRGHSLRRFTLTEQEKKDLVDFLERLAD